MTGLNLHNTVADALAIINPYMQATFSKKQITWSPLSRTPTEIVSQITVNCKIQPADLQTITALGVQVQSYQYFRIFISADITQIDMIRQLGCDEFVIGNEKYKIVAKSDWIQNGWREGYCYLMGIETPEPEENEGDSENE